MRERKISKVRLIMIIILLCAVGYYAVRFVVPLFFKSERVPDAEPSSGGEFYTANVSEFQHYSGGGQYGTFRVKGSEAAFFAGNSAYSTITKEYFITTVSDRGVSSKLDYENERNKVKGSYSGRLDSVSVMFNLLPATLKGCRDYHETNATFYVEFHS